MGKIKLTQRSVETLKSKGASEFWWDTDLAGFGVRISAGGTKSFVVQYRMGGRGSRERRYTIGKDGEVWNATNAREEARRRLRAAAMGIDTVATERRRQQDDIDLEFGKYAERFLQDYGKRHWRARTFQSRAADLRRWVVPVLEGIGLPSIARRDIAAVFDGLPPKSPALPRNVFAVTRKLFVWAVQRGDIERSPCDGIKPPPPVASRDHVLDDYELMLVSAMSDHLNAPFEAFLTLLIITGQRREEVAGMTWDELYRGKREWVLPAARSKNHTAHSMPLGKLAIRTLDALAAGPSWPRKGYVFTTTGKTSISGFSKMKRRLDELVAQVDEDRRVRPWRLHDLRRTMATNLQRLGVRFEVTEALLNHVSGARSGIAGVYQRHDWRDEKREAVRLWEDRLAKMAEKFPKKFLKARASAKMLNEAI
ncbi:tyrosine-type recombinase/integrase [Sphingomonas panacisoli]|uniref:Tyrosine-type recombinase/integrase n=1 Tax=Sphingomonas panacisoli TaxID=1813879 RepID=A0A5B8LGV4_9SPHN|nr:site-specific integrase [Sphingomonas panacisoli]QDZ06370.1 tyrosine-type recombinase/integrase [Sphingomonas panacisoli]